MITDLWDFIRLPDEVDGILQHCRGVTFPASREELLSLSMGPEGADVFDVCYDIPGLGEVVEATLVRCTNGVAVNYTDPYMRRRDPHSMLIADSRPTDKETYHDRYGVTFDSVREETFEWLRQQELIVTFFKAGGPKLGFPAMLVVPKNAAFFALALADLQGCISPDEIDASFVPRTVIYLAPSFRYTHFDGEQVVVHNRMADVHEIFSYNLYPGPSAKKGVYGALLTHGEEEGWVTAHGATVKLTTPYDNTFTIMHEGASGSGKSEMLEEMHRQPDGRVLFGENTVTGDRLTFAIGDTCMLNSITDDMALCHPSIQKNDRKLMVTDAEQGWFLRIDHITEYGTAPHYEKLTIHPEEPLLFMNIKGTPGATCLIWEHTEDEPGVRCPNPRVVVPRKMVPGVMDGSVAVDLRSFGIRTPPCTKDSPSYGIVGAMHILPPSLGWLWRLVSPRGHDNPSIVSRGIELSSEGVGSYWPFATGKYVKHANLLLEQILAAPATRFTLFPNQYIGAWHVGFMPQWLGREYLARRGSAKYQPDQMGPARSPLLGYALRSMRVDGNAIPRELLEVHLQPEVGDEGYDAGAAMLEQFFRDELRKYLTSELHPLGREIIECCLAGGTVEDYAKLIPME